MESHLSDEDKQELEDALAKLRTKMDVLEERAQLNEIKFNHEDYKEVLFFPSSHDVRHVRTNFYFS